MCEGGGGRSGVALGAGGGESVVPVRAEGAGSRAAAQGRGRRARAIVEKGAGLGPMLSALCRRPPLQSSLVGRGLG